MTLTRPAAALVLAGLVTPMITRADPPVPDAARTAWVLDVEQRAEANLARIRAAYRSGVGRQLPIGSLKIVVVVGSDGRVSSAAVGGATLGMEHVGGAAVRAVHQWRFPPPPNCALLVLRLRLLLVH